jgi:hypothetical protein
MHSISLRLPRRIEKSLQGLSVPDVLGFSPAMEALYGAIILGIRTQSNAPTEWSLNCYNSGRKEATEFG